MGGLEFQLAGGCEVPLTPLPFPPFSPISPSNSATLLDGVPAGPLFFRDVAEKIYVDYGEP